VQIVKTQENLLNFHKKQLLRTQISKAQKDTDDLAVFFALLGSARVKALHKMLMKLTIDSFFEVEMVDANDRP